MRQLSPAFDAYVAPARRANQLWLTILGLIIAFVVYAFTVVLIFLVVWIALGADMDPELLWLEDIINADTPQAMLILLATFLGMAAGVFAATAMLHERSPGTLFGRAPVVLRDFTIAALVTFTVIGLSLLVWYQFNDPIPGLDLTTWLKILPLALVLIAIQTGAEELVFRGYLQQQLAARFRHPLIWAVIPALIFGVAHFDIAAAGDNVWLVVGAAFFFGLLAADLTAKTGSIGAAWGFHFANNCFALTLIATQGTLTGLALYQTPYDVSDVEALRQGIPLDLAIMVAIWLVIRRLVRR